MKDVAAVLEEMADRADERLLADPGTVRRTLAPRAARRRRLRVTGVVVAAAAVAAVGWLVPSGSGQRNEPAPPVDHPTTTPSGFPVRGDWLQVRGVFGAEVGFSALAVHDGRYVVVGDTSVDDTGPEGTGLDGAKVSVWWSDDAFTWHRPDESHGPRSRNLWDVVAVDDGFVTVGVLPGGGSTSWFSPDGETWQPSRSVPPGFSPFGVTSTRLGLVAWGYQRIWLSTDRARTWTPAAGGRIFPRNFATGEPCWVEQQGDRIVALALHGRTESELRAVRWTSSDGRRWVEEGPVRSPDGPLLQCIAAEHLHQTVTGPAGTVDIDPYSESDSIFVRR